MTAQNREALIQTLLASTEAVQRQWKAVLFAELKGNISLAQLAILRLIAEKEPVSSNSLSTFLQITPGAITQLVDGLAKDNYVVRQSDPNDRRVTNITVSARGKKLLKKLEERRNRIFMNVFETLSDEELVALTAYQEKLLERLTTLRPNPNK